MSELFWRLSSATRPGLRLWYFLTATSLATPLVADNPYEPNSDWEPQAQSFNLSTFTYLDRNESGTYDLGDQPLSGIVTVLRREGTELDRVRSNENGFGNFKASRVDSDVPIYELGAYTFEVLVPPDWTNTSGNAIQTQTFMDAEGAAMGGALDAMMAPIGLIPPKAISGKTDPSVSLVLTGPGLAKKTVDVQKTGEFRVIVPTQGRYSLSSGDTTVPVDMEEYPVHIGTLRAPEPISGELTTATFENVSGNQLRKVPSGYGGLTWFNINAIKNTFGRRSNRGYINNVTSGTFLAYTSSGHPSAIGHPDGFDVVQMSIGTAWPNAEGETAVFEFLRDGVVVATDEVTLSVYAPVIYTPRIANVTEIRITTKHYWQLVMDDLVFGLPH